jgi:hypothetical protein
MNRVILLLALLIVSVGVSAQTVSTSPDQANTTQQATVTQKLTSMPLPFTRNMGQWPDSILFRASANGATMWFTKNGIWYQFVRKVEKSRAAAKAIDYIVSGFGFSPVGRDLFGPDMAGDSIETTMIKAEFAGAIDSVEVEGLEELDYKCNYFLGNDKSKWRTDVPNYGAVTMRGLYPGVDVTFSRKDGRLLEQINAPSSNDLARVKVEYHSAVGVNLQNDNIATVPWAADVPSAPFSDGHIGYVLRTTVQTSIGGHHFEGALLTNRYGSKSESQISSATSSASGVNIVYSTYLGGDAEDDGEGIAVDAVGSAYLIGQTSSADFPTQNPFQPSLGAPPGVDIFVTKLSPGGNGLVYSTFLGGSGSESNYYSGIAVDGTGSAYVTGYTNSPDFPTANPFDGSWNGTAGDAFVAKLSPAGNSLVYSTYLGGSNDPVFGGRDEGRSIAVDGAGSAYVAGVTYCYDFPTANPYDGSWNGYSDVFVTKLSPTGNSLVYSTYLGGSNDPLYGGRDEPTGIAVDGAGSAYVTGGTFCSDFPTQNPYDGSLSGRIDAFVTKLSPAGSSLVYSTYLGGSNDPNFAGRDVAYGIAVDGAGSAYVAGITACSDFPTHNPYDGSLRGMLDVFVTKLSPDGSGPAYSTYLGGSGEEWNNCAIALDGAGSAYVTGYTISSDFPTANPFDGSLGGTGDAFVTKLSPAGNSLIYSSYLGGGDWEQGSACIAVDGAGSAYVSGMTFSSDFPTVTPFDGTLSGSYDAYVTKVSSSLSSCCVGTTGNVDCNPTDAVDISDLSALIDNLFVSFTSLCCQAEANVDGQPGIDVSDLTALIDYLYISFTPPAPCQ